MKRIYTSRGKLGSSSPLSLHLDVVRELQTNGDIGVRKLRTVGIIAVVLGIIGAITCFKIDFIAIGFMCCIIATVGFFSIAACYNFSENDKW